MPRVEGRDDVVGDVAGEKAYEVERGGVERVVEIPLDEEERAGLRASADLLRRTTESARAGRA